MMFRIYRPPSDDSPRPGCGCHLLGLLLVGMFLVLFTLKLCGVVEVSWLWVTAPLWGPVALVAGLFLAVMLVAAVVDLVRLAGRRK